MITNTSPVQLESSCDDGRVVGSNTLVFCVG
jgi:hypothetical protein